MLIGRFSGTFAAAFLAATVSSEILWKELVLIFIFAIIGTIVGMIFSAMFGSKISTDEPLAQDSLEYWTKKYGEDLGNDAYKLWLEQLDTTSEG